MSGSPCSSQSQCQEAADQKRIDNLSGIRNKIVVLSGKGGVGKSTVSANIAVALARQGKKVGLLDVDLHGPSIPRLLGLLDVLPEADDERLYPVEWSDTLKVMSLGLLMPNPDEAAVMRGPMKMGVIQQFLRDVAWGELDYLVVDCPPGTGDEPMAVLQQLGRATRAVVVTTPQQVAISDVRRSLSFCKNLGIPVLGLVENMSGYVCPHCDKIEYLFETGGGTALANETGFPLLGRIPLDPHLVRSGDSGQVFIGNQSEGPTVEAIQDIVRPILALGGCD